MKPDPLNRYVEDVPDDLLLMWVKKLVELEENSPPAAQKGAAPQWIRQLRHSIPLEVAKMLLEQGSAGLEEMFHQRDELKERMMAVCAHADMQTTFVRVLNDKAVEDGQLDDKDVAKFFLYLANAEGLSVSEVLEHRWEQLTPATQEIIEKMGKQPPRFVWLRQGERMVKVGAQNLALPHPAHIGDRACFDSRMSEEQLEKKGFKGEETYEILAFAQ